MFEIVVIVAIAGILPPDDPVLRRENELPVWCDGAVPQDVDPGFLLISDDVDSLDDLLVIVHIEVLGHHVDRLLSAAPVKASGFEAEFAELSGG